MVHSASPLAIASPRTIGAARAPRRLAAGLFAMLLALGFASCERAPDAGSPSDAARAVGARAEPVGLVVVDPLVPERPHFHDFDVVRFGEQVEHTFRLRNTSEAPITVRDVLPNCSCTVPRLWIEREDGEREVGNSTGRGPVGVVPPGGSADLHVRIDSEYAGVSNNHKLAQVRLRCDAPETPYLNFELHLFVEKPFVIVPRPPVDLGRIGHSVGGTGTFEIVPSASFPEARVVGFTEPPSGIQLELEEVRLVGTAFTRVTVRVLPFASPGRLQHTLEFQTEGGDAGADETTLQVPMLATVSEDIYTRPSVLELPRQAPTARGEAVVELASLLPGHRLAVNASRLMGERSESLEAVLEPVAPDDEGRSARWTVRLRPIEDVTPGSFGGILHLELDDPQFPRVAIPYRGWVDG